MSTPKKSFKLSNYDGQNIFDVVFGDSNPTQDKWYFVDWSLDGNGNLQVISKQEYTIQSALKCVFTERQPSGYGTGIFDLVGEKDVMVKRVSIMMDLTMAMLAMKVFADAQAIKQDLSSEDLISTMSQFQVTEDQNDPSMVRIKMRLVSNAGTETQIGVL